MESPRTRYARASDGTSIAYQVVGEGPVDLTFATYLANLDTLWELPPAAEFLGKLATFSRLILHDQRGTGLSDRAAEGLTIETRGDDLLSALDAADSSRTVLVGSMNGGVATAMLAAAHPERTSAFVWYAPTPRGAWAPDYPWGETEEEFLRDAEVVEAQWGTEECARVYFERENPSITETPTVVKWLAKMLRQQVTPGAALASERIWYETDVRHVLPSIMVPTLVIDRDGVTPEEGEYTASLIPGCRRIVVRGDDAIYFLGDQDAIVDAIRDFVGAPSPAPYLDRVLATVLFTDIVGSTQKAADLGDAAWKELVERHDATVRGLLKRYRGTEVKTMGDGFLATFDGPARAVKCAQGICEAVKPLGIEVRAGCHTGEIELVGADVGGIAVHIGARVGALAGPSEVLVSSTVKDLVAGSGLVFEDRGEHRLKGVPDPWHLYAVAS
jgi:class 3 adenylate cyclase